MIVVCGDETVSLKDQSQLVLSYVLNSGLQTLQSANYNDYFESSEPGCPVTFFRLIKYDSLGDIKVYTDEDIRMN